MSLEKAKKQLTSIANTTGTKYPKVLIAELCNVIKLLVDEIEQIKTPSLEVLTFEDEGVNLDPHPSQRPISPIFDPDDVPENPSYHKSPPSYNPNERYRKGNAGDVK